MFFHPLRRCAPAALAAFGACVCAFGAAPAVAAPVGHALDRPALMSQRAAQSVLLSLAYAGKRLVAVGERGIVMLSDDDGASWRQVATPVSVTLSAVRFADERHGYAVGHGGAVLASADGGASWTRVFDGRQAARVALAAAHAGGNPAAVREAERLVADGPDKPLLDLMVPDARTVIVVGAYGTAYASRDGGKTWNDWSARLQNRGGMHLYAIRGDGRRVLVAGEQGLVRLSEDGGQSFVPLKTPYEGSFFTAELGAGGDILLAGLRGNIWRSRDSGQQWARVEGPDAAAITASTVGADGALLLATQAGTVLREDQGRFLALKHARLPPLSAILPRPDGSLLALSFQGVLAVPGGAK